MKVLLVNPPIRLPEDFAHYPTFSTLGVLANAAWLRARGRDVQVVDAFTLPGRLHMRPDGEAVRHLGAEVPDLAEEVRRQAGEGPEPVVLVVAVTMFSDLNRLDETLIPAVVAALREEVPRASIGLATLFVCGMNYFPFDVEAVLARVVAADWVLVGEGEPTLPELLDRLEGGATLEGIARIGRRDPKGRVFFDARAPVPLGDLDALPLPAFDLLDMERYFAVHAEAIGAELVHEYHVPERQLPFMTSRGCPFRCNFCTNQVLGLPWRAHSVDYVRNAVRELRDRYRVDRFLFLDDNINVNEARFRDLVRGLAEEGIPWDAINGYRADHLDREMVLAIKRAGNTKITVSAESGDPQLLNDVIGKRLKLPSVVKLAKLCADERMPLQVHYILGVPGETRAQINKTLEFSTVLFEKHGAWPLLQHAIPFPGTQLFQACEEQGYFVAPPNEVPGALLEVRSIIRTPEFAPEQVDRMKRNGQHLHAAIQALPYVVVETRCSNRCASCPCDGRDIGGEPPTRERVRAELERALFLGGREVFLGGGEPTLRSDLGEIIAEARDMGFDRVSLITNAHGLATAEQAAPVLAARVDRLVVGLHAPDASAHDAIARRPGAFRATIAGVRRATGAGVRLEVSVTVLRDNLTLIARTVRRALALGVDAVHLRIPPPDSRAAADDRVPSWAELLPALREGLAVDPRGRVSVQGAPLCLMPEQRGAIRPVPPWELARTRRLKVRRPQCDGCVGLVVCGGFFEDDARYGMADAAQGEPVGAVP